MTPEERWNLQHGHEHPFKPISYKIDSPVDMYILSNIKARELFEKYQKEKEMKKIIEESVEKTVEKEIKKQIEDIFK